jgi:hypothetical protein
METTKQQPERVQGLMHLAGLERSNNGAVFMRLENDSGFNFLTPLEDILPTLKVLFGTRFVKLRGRVYYGRQVYKIDLKG